MDWNHDGLNFKSRKALPSIFDSQVIDAEVESRKRPEDEIVATPEKPSPLVVVASQFPHISKRVVEFWGRPKDINDYLSSVVVMDRSDRRGFKAEVIESLLSIWEQHRRLFDAGEPEVVSDCPWSDDPSLHKAFKKLELEQRFVARTGLTGAEAALLDAHLL